MNQRDQQRDDFYAVQNRHYKQCLKEVKIITIICLAAIIYCPTAIYFWGYVPAEMRTEEISLVWGFPSWVFWGLFAPWVVVIVSTWWFALRVLKDDEPLHDFPEPLEESDLPRRTQRKNQGR